MIQIIVYLAVSNVLSLTWYSWIIPFFPLELDKYGIQSTWAGYIFSVYALGLITGSLLVPVLLKRFNRRSILILGTLSESISIWGLGEVGYFSNSTYIVMASMLWRFIEGWWAGVGQATQYSIISLVYPSKIEKYQGIIESSMGTGLVLGPLIGSSFYKLLGFEWTFRIIGSALFIQGWILAIFFPRTFLPQVDEKVEDLLEEDRETQILIEDDEMNTNSQDDWSASKVSVNSHYSKLIPL